MPHLKETVQDRCMALRIEPADCAKFASMQHEWNGLLEQTTADPLSMSWLWQYTWWDVLSRTKPLQLRLTLVRRADGELVGIAPLYVIPVRQFGITTRRLQLLGCCWRNPADIYSEYLDLIVKPGMEAEVTAALLDYLMRCNDWEELVIPRSTLDSEVTSTARAWLRQRGCYVRDVDLGLTLAVQTSGSKDEFLRQLGPKTRRAMFGARARLAQSGTVARVSADMRSVDRQLAQLQEFHCRRFGRPAFHEDALSFHRRLVAQLLPRNQVQLEVLQVEDACIAVMFNYIVDGTCYGQQYGFDAQFDPRLSLGLLYVGLVIEDAFERSIDLVDMGRAGPDAAYKHKIGHPHRQMRTVHAIRSLVWKNVYRLHGVLKGSSQRIPASAAAD